MLFHRKVTIIVLKISISAALQEITLEIKTLQGHVLKVREMCRPNYEINHEKLYMVLSMIRAPGCIKYKIETSS